MRKLLMLALLLLASCTTGTSKSVDCSDRSSCIKAVKKKLTSNFIAKKHFKGHEVTIEFFLNDNAEVIEYKVISESGIPELEVAGINAIKDSSPFYELKSLPKDTFHEFKHVKLTLAPEF